MSYKHYKQMMMRLGACMLIFSLLVGLFPSIGLAENGNEKLVMKVADTKVSSTQNIEVPIYIVPGTTVYEGDAFNSYEMTLNYDADALVLKDVQDHLDSGIFDYTNDSPGTVHIKADNFNGSNEFVMDEQNVFTLIFEVAEGASPGELPITLTSGKYTNMDESEILTSFDVGQEQLISGLLTFEQQNTPTASEVSISGTSQVGNVLTGNYNYEDNEKGSEGQSTFKWYSAAEATGVDKIVVGSEKSLTITEDLLGKYLFFEVTPVASEGGIMGEPVLSAPLGPVVSSSLEVAVNVKTVNGVKGETVDIPVILSSASEGVASFGLELKFDPSVLEISGIAGPGKDDFASFYNNDEGWLRVGWADKAAGEQPIHEGQVLFTLSVKVKEDAQAGLHLLNISDLADIEQFSLTNANNSEMDKSFLAGGVKIIGEYTVSIGNVSGGKIIASPVVAEAGQTVTLVIQPESGKQLKAGTLKYTTGEMVTEIKGNSFIMPESSVKVTAEFEDVATSAPGNTSTTSTPSTETATEPNKQGVPILVNGKMENIAKSQTTTVNKRTVTTITPNVAKLQQMMEKEKDGLVVTIPASEASDVVIGKLTGDMVKLMEDKSAVLELTTPIASYKLKASELAIQKIATDLDAKANLGEVIVEVNITKADTDVVSRVNHAASKNGFSVMVQPIEFTIDAKYDGKSVEIKQFQNFVERTLALPEDIDPNKITTGIVVKEDGSTYHVPTYVKKTGERYYAVINSLTNSTYTVVFNNQQFADTNNHWASGIVNDMASRMIINGLTATAFQPDQAITRAEFAALIVRAMGLAPEGGASSFADVPESTWYAGYVKTAYNYNLINGYAEDRFGPQKLITREQAMTILAKAMKWTGISPALSESQSQAVLSAFTDSSSISKYAEASIAACLETGLAQGRSATKLAPDSNITRAEATALVQRLLEKSSLIDKK
ncbi:hypothetical protein J2Z32_000351 [Paenibacillus turicensis]|uniref:SLH domain-containing protein n=1 Tax=Paenibacillus turicensis TaxID=160487 RepID=A0ABS4FME4_9BACL|nr:S-layer homology domain-containing protein [Paenibacillus turicensis]MBP1903739.1 hypothetical protein [Paenibacillus turicensis]